MRLLSARLIVSLIVGITLVSLGFSYFEVVGEKRTLRSDLERRAEVLGESVAGNVEKSWETGSERGLQRLVQRFSNREHLLGVAVYDRQGKEVAITSELGQALRAAPQSVIQAMSEGHGEGLFVRMGHDPVHIFALPLYRQDEVVGGLAIVHDVSYIHAQTLRAWREAFLRILVQGLPYRVHHAADRALEHRWPHRSGRAMDARASHGRDFITPTNARPGFI
jgi:hypothetical protein